jgi:DNA-binding XRE family transcriptional regulator
LSFTSLPASIGGPTHVPDQDATAASMLGADLSSIRPVSLSPLAESLSNPQSATQARSDFLRALGLMVRTMRESKGLSQRALAKKCKLSPETIGNTEAGRSEPLLSTLVNLCYGLGCSVNDLLGDCLYRKPAERDEPGRRRT